MDLKVLNLSGTYMFSAWNAFAFLGCAVRLLEDISHAVKISLTGEESRSSDEISPTSPSSGCTETSPLLEKSAQAVPQSSQISVKGTNTRVYRLYFDNRRIRFYQMYDVGAGVALFPSPQPCFSCSECISHSKGRFWMWLWSREWNKMLSGVGC